MKELNEHEILILGMPNFKCGVIARRLREFGFVIPEKSETEQAYVIAEMLEYYKAYGEDWKSKFEQYLNDGICESTID